MSKETIITRQTNIKNELYQLSVLEEKETRKLIQVSMIDFDTEGNVIKENVFEYLDFTVGALKLTECIFRPIELKLRKAIEELETDIELVIDNRGLNVIVNSEVSEGVETVLYKLNSKEFDKVICSNMLNTIEVYKLEYTKTVIDLLSRSLQNVL